MSTQLMNFVHKDGHAFEEGEVAYAIRGLYAVRVVAPNKRTYPFDEYISFFFDFDDGLWATRAVRLQWKREPHTHPHCTLFKMLQENLEVRDIQS